MAASRVDVLPLLTPREERQRMQVEAYIVDVAAELLRRERERMRNEDRLVQMFRSPVRKRRREKSSSPCKDTLANSVGVQLRNAVQQAQEEAQRDAELEEMLE